VETIILEICEEFINEVCGFFGDGQAKKLASIETELLEKSHQFLLKMTKAYFESLDRAIAQDRGRLKRGLVIERKDDERTIYTQLGTLRFKRTYYRDRKNKGYLYLLDQAVGLEAYSRVSSAMAVELVNHASQSSYGESAQHISNGEISRQTVMEHVRRTKRLETEPVKEKRKVKILHVEADEDHVPMQDGTNTIVPLISIHEGIERNGRRGRCKNIHHISRYGIKAEDLWRKAAEWIYNTYDTEEIERIYLHGDGASWIKSGLDELPKARMVLDRYHLNKAVLEATGGYSDYRKEMFKVLRNCDKKAFKDTVKRMLNEATETKKQDRIKQFRTYILNNWDGVAVYGEENCTGSCTEGHVSHVLSSRLSSRPMGWSRQGLKSMAELRAFVCSGGQLKVKDLVKKQDYNCYKPSKRELRTAAKVFNEVAIETRGNVPALKKGTVTYLFKALRTLKNGVDL